MKKYFIDLTLFCLPFLITAIVIGIFVYNPPVKRVNRGRSPVKLSDYYYLIKDFVYEK